MHTQPLLLGIDVGTSTVKAVLYSLDGAEQFSTRRDIAMSTPRAGWAEQDANTLWHALLAVLSETASAAHGRGRLATLALATQAGSVAPVDADGAPLAPLITWLDTRAHSVVDDWISNGSATKIRRISGWRPHPGLPIATIAWMTQQMPDTLRRATHLLDVHGYLLHRLTGQPLTDFSGAAEMLLLDRTTTVWSDELCELAGVQSNLLPRLAPAGTLAANLRPDVAAATGLPANLPVVIGGHDQCCTALGMGVTAPGQHMLAAGTAWVITALTPDLPVEQVPDAMELNFFITPGLHTVSQLLGGFGAASDWWMRMLWPDRTDRYAAWDSALAASEAGAHDLRFAPIGGSAQLGSGRGGFIGLRLDHTRNDLVRAICEGIACEVRWALDTLAAAHMPAQRIWMSGGATLSAQWLHLIADVTGLPVQSPRASNWPARGAAILAGVGAGLLGDDALQASQRWRVPLAEVTPDRSLRATYAALYADYCAVVALLRS
jgi:xylulokinase